MVALNAKIQELETTKEVAAKDTEETIIQLTIEKFVPEVNLDIALAKSKKSFMKVN